MLDNIINLSVIGVTITIKCFLFLINSTHYYDQLYDTNLSKCKIIAHFIFKAWSITHLGFLSQLPRIPIGLYSSLSLRGSLLILTTGPHVHIIVVLVALKVYIYLGFMKLFYFTFSLLRTWHILPIQFFCSSLVSLYPVNCTTNWRHQWFCARIRKLTYYF